MGKTFIAVFPENIAYYHPTPPQNKVRVLALHNFTNVTLMSPSLTFPSSAQLMSGQTEEYPINEALELNKSNISTRSISITSTQNITVEILSQRNNSIQTALIVPTDQLGTNYRVPPIPIIQGTTEPAINVTPEVTERSPFRLIIVNGPQSNNIQIENSGSARIELRSNEVAQVGVRPDMVGKSIQGAQPFLVLFSHSCAIQYNCTCGLLYTPLLPEKTDILNFYIPPVFSKGAENNTYLLVSATVTSSPFSSRSSTVQSKGTVVLQRPGLLINLIPETEFGTCFAIQTVNNVDNSVIIMVPKNQKDGTKIGANALNVTWQDVPGTAYVYAMESLSSGKNIVWHTSALMAVWFVGKKVQSKNVWFGNPAPLISKDPGKTLV